MASDSADVPAMPGNTPDCATHDAATHDAATHVAGSATAHGERGRYPRWHGFTAFVLSGGGARGALQVGALRALLEANVHPDIIVGTSAGAWNGAMLAHTPTLAGVERLATAWIQASPAQVLLGRDVSASARAPATTGLLFLAAARRVARGDSSLYSNVGLRQLIERHIAAMLFADLAVPLHVVATDLSRGTRAVFSRGPVGPAVLASSAIPGIFPPVQIEGRLHVDGGALDNYNLDLALELGARRVFVLDVGYSESTESLAELMLAWEIAGRRGTHVRAHAMAAIIERTAQTMSRYHLARALRQVPRGVEMHVLHLAAKQSGGALTFGEAAYGIARGYEEAKEYLATHPAAVAPNPAYHPAATPDAGTGTHAVARREDS